MRVLWIGKEPGDNRAGDEIFDSKTIVEARAMGHTIDLFHPRRVGRLKEGINLLRGIPHQRTRYASNETLGRMRAKSLGYDMVISSWEPFDWLALQLDVPVMLILHNITSRSLPAIFPDSLPASVLAKRVRNWEQRQYSRKSHLRVIGVLSRRDQSFIESLSAPPDVVYLPPGMPRPIQLNSEADLLKELIILGTFDWLPKKRDVTLFARDYLAAGSELIVRADRLPPHADKILKSLPAPTPKESSEAIRFGIITDRFESGHKFKTTAYIASNNIVLSFSDVSFDFDHIPDHDFFIRRVRSFEEMQAAMHQIAEVPQAALRERFATFKRRCVDCFNWANVAARLMEAAVQAT